MVGNAKGQAAAVFISIRANFNEDGWKRYQSAVPIPVGFGDVIGRIVTGVTTTTTTARAQGLRPYSLALAREEVSMMAENTRAYWSWEAQQAGLLSFVCYHILSYPYIFPSILILPPLLPPHSKAPRPCPSTRCTSTTLRCCATSSSDTPSPTLLSLPRSPPRPPPPAPAAALLLGVVAASCC